MTEAFERLTDNGAKAIAVFAHIHYPDVWAGMADLLAERMDIPFRLMITSSLPDLAFEEPRTPFYRGATVVSAENRGRDIRPFLMALGEAGDFDIGLKLHTKRSTHLLEGDDWRDEILFSLLPPPPGIAAIGRAFANGRVGMIAPEGLLLPVRDWILRNRRPMTKVSAILDPTLDRTSFAEGCFAAGSMFWFRREALSGFADAKLLGVFERESGQVDGTIAHAIERLFAVKAERDGFVALPMNAVADVDADMSADDLRTLSRVRSETVSSFFRKPRIVRLLARHVPWILGLYRILPMGMRRRLRDGLIGARQKNGSSDRRRR